MIDVIFNDLSSDPIAENKNVGMERMSTFIFVLIHAFKNGINGCLRTDTDFFLTRLSNDYTINDWVVDPVIDRDEKNFFLAISTKSPYLCDVRECITSAEQTMEMFVEKLTSLSLVTSHLLDNPLISFNQPQWRDPIIVGELHILDENTTEIEITPAIQLVNFSRLEHVEIHQDWVRKRLLKDLDSMKDLWRNKSELFSNLDFCPSVESQLVQINRNDPRFIQVLNKLFQLEDYCSEWDNGAFDKDAFPKCNPVSRETLKSYGTNYTFKNSESVSVTANWHLYFTPGAGRIYFDPDTTTRRCTICHVGDKLLDVTYGSH